MTVRELIEALSKYQPYEQVGVRASCCLHVHGIESVRPPDTNRDIVHEETVVLETD